MAADRLLLGWICRLFPNAGDVLAIANADKANAADEHGAIARIPVPDQIAWCPLPAARA
jgi:hypothetical protein